MTHLQKKLDELRQERLSKEGSLPTPGVESEEISEPKVQQDMFSLLDFDNTILDSNQTIAASDRRFSAERTSETLKVLSNHHLEIIRMVAMGVKPSTIALIAGVTPVTIRNIMRSDLAKARLRQLNAMRDMHAAEIGLEIRLLAHEATEKAATIMRAERGGISPDTQLRAAFGLLDRGGFGPIKHIQKTEQGVIKHVLANIKSRAEEMGILEVKESCNEQV